MVYNVYFQQNELLLCSFGNKVGKQHLYLLRQPFKATLH